MELPVRGTRTAAKSAGFWIIALPVWRTIVTLCRFGGLRCPSEVLSLKWSDIDWAQKRMTVHSPKTERHEGGASRVVPLFPEVAVELREAFERADEGAVCVIEGFSRPKGKTIWRNVNLRTQFERIITKAGVPLWPRLFHAMRSSCETELVRKHPLHIVTKWLGHSPKVALQHYLQTTESEFEETTRGLESGAESDARCTNDADSGAASASL